ncbi:MAG: GTP-binding protein [Candidatus Thorarchaeota archaeon]|nr:GTP-binding protein [Candidatus Thorarchaeota archaeon]
MMRYPRRQFKICLIGDGYVGKTSVRRQYLREGFKTSYIPTLGVDFAQKTVTLDGETTNLVIWDIAGQPAFEGLRRRYYLGCSGIILIYSVVDRTSFENASKWLVEAHGYMGKLPPLIIAGNKVDLRESHRAQDTVSTEEGRSFAELFSERMNTPVFFIETSAVTGQNIDDAFMALTRMMTEIMDKKSAASVAARAAEQPTLATASSSENLTEQKEATPAVEEVRSPFAPVSTTSSKGRTVSTSEVGDTVPSATPVIDPITALPSDSPLLQEERVAAAMKELSALRAELQNKEEEMAKALSELDTRLLTLRNTVYVKQIMYDHLKAQLTTTRQEWAEAYDEYLRIDKRRSEELTRRSDQIQEIRKGIDKVSKTIIRRISELERGGSSNGPVTTDT